MIRLSLSLRSRLNSFKESKIQDLVEFNLRLRLKTIKLIFYSIGISSKIVNRLIIS